MINNTSRSAKTVKILGSVILAIGLVFFLLRGPYLSNYIKRILIPVLENATRERIIIDKAVINLFPFYVQTKGFKVFDKEGNRLLRISKARAYIDVLGLLSKEIRVRKLTLKRPELTTSEKDVQRMLSNLGKSDSVGEDGEYSVSIGNIKLTNGNVVYRSEKGQFSISGDGVYLDRHADNASATITILMKNGTVSLRNQSEVHGGVKGRLKIEKNRLEILELSAHSSNSSFSTEGEILLSDEGKITEGSLSTKIKVYTEIIHKIFEVTQQKEGFLSYEGSIKLSSGKDSDWPDLTFDGNVDGQFYLETLMEILGVDETITGKVSASAKVGGSYPELLGNGTAKLEKAVFDTLPIDDAVGRIAYEKGKFSIDDITAHTYDGKLNGDAHVLIPGGEYSVSAMIDGISSSDLFRYLTWEPLFPEGRIDGTVQLKQRKDDDIELTAELTYLNSTDIAGDVLKRVRDAYADIELKKGILNLNSSALATSQSDLIIAGAIDLNRNMLDLAIILEGRDLSDLTSPYYSKISAPVTFDGTMTGRLDDPVLAGSLHGGAGTLHEIGFTDAVSDLTYTMKKLSVDRLKIQQGQAGVDLSGTVDFPGAKELFSFEGPIYRAKASLDRLDITSLADAMDSEGIPLSGIVSGDLSFHGDAGALEGKGDLTVQDGTVYGEPLDKIDVKVVADREKIEFQSVTAYTGDSSLTAKGTLYFDKNFTLSASSEKILLSDLHFLRDVDVDALLSLNVTGEGTIDDPAFDFTSTIMKSSFRELQTGSGKIQGSVKEGKLTASGSFIDGLVNTDGHVIFSENPVWNIDAHLRKGNYEHVFANFGDRVPEDFAVSIEGQVTVKGEGRDFSLQSRLPSVEISLYGYNLKNNQDIVVDVLDDQLQITSFSLAEKNAGISAEGTVDKEGGYNVTLSGYLDPSPLSSLSDSLSSLQGRFDFSLGVLGTWEKPEAVGEITISDAIAVFPQYPHIVGPAEGTVFLRQDRIVFHSLQSGFSGGNVIFSGSGHIDGLNLNSFYVSADMTDITLRPAEGLSALLDGRLFYEKHAKKTGLTGNIDIKKARYSKRIEWKRWLLGLGGGGKEQLRFPEFVGNTSVNLHITGSEDIVIDNNIARARLKLLLNVTGTLEDPGLLGRVESNTGIVYFRSNEFQILKGSLVEFVEPEGILPVFHINADSYINEYYVKLSLDGTMDDFSLSLFSDPPLPESSILTLVTFGQAVKAEKGIDSGMAAGEAAAILTGSIQEELEEELGYSIGIDRFEVRPHTTTEGALVPKVIVGKRLFEDKLFVIYSSAIGTAEESLFRLEYKLNKEVSLIGSRNEIGSMGAGMKYRFEFK